jgi:hypothetical protein
MSEEVKPWDQRDGETDKAFSAFRIYRDLHPSKRSLKECAKHFYGPTFKRSNVRTCEKWSVKYEWQRRVRLYDAHRDQLMRDEDLEDRRKMRDTHIEEARGLQSIGIESLKRIKKQMETDKGYRLSAGLTLQLIQQGSSMERLARGEPTEISGSADAPRSWADWLASLRRERGLPDRPNPFEKTATATEEAESVSGNGSRGNGSSGNGAH